MINERIDELGNELCKVLYEIEEEVYKNPDDEVRECTISSLNICDNCISDILDDLRSSVE